MTLLQTVGVSVVGVVTENGALLLPSASPIETREGKVSHKECDSLLIIGRTYPRQYSLQTVGMSVVGVIARSGASAIARCQPDRNQRRQGIAHKVQQPTKCWSDVPLPTYAPNGRSVRSRGGSRDLSLLLPSASPIETREGKVSHTQCDSLLIIGRTYPCQLTSKR